MRKRRLPGQMRPTLPNAGIRVAYQRKLEALIDEMHRSVLYWLRATYRSRESEIAQDASPSRELAAQLRKRAAQWRKRFADDAGPFARSFIAQVDKYSSSATKQAAVSMTGLGVSMKDTLITNNVLQASVTENVSLIKSIQEQYFTQVEGLVMRSVTAGRDLKTLTDELEQRYGITRRRAKFIANDQNNKATAQMARVRQQSLGCTKARWRHTGGGKHPRHSHVAVDGKIFDLNKGLYIDGKWIFPGEEPNCGCTGEPIIPGVDDENDD
jgi:SPP1 gp7 family putative phage head morphogenesis protein